MIKIFFLSKKYTLVPKLSYMFYEKYFMKQNIIFKNLFPIFNQFSKSAWDSGEGDVDGYGENFLIGKCCENEMTQSQHIQKAIKTRRCTTVRNSDDHAIPLR